jgi:hypothetical protein
MRRSVGALAVLAGTALIVFTFGWRLFDRSEDAERISDQYRPLMSEQGLADLRTGFDMVAAGGSELTTRTLPDLQQALGMDDDEFATYLSQQMSGLQAFADQAPAVVALVDPVIGTMEAVSDDYARADDIPIGALPLSSAPYLFLAVGIVLIGTGISVWRRPRPATFAGAAVIGCALVVVPLAVSLPGKIDAAERVSVVGRIGLAPATGERAVAATQLFDGAAADASVLLPEAFARARGTTYDEARAALARDYPALTAFTTSWPAISGPAHDLSDSQVELSDSFADADRIPLGAVPWLFLVPGVLLAVTAGAHVALDRTRSASADGRARSRGREPSAARQELA